MSRTPEVIVNKTAQTIRGWVIAAGCVAALLAFGSFSNEGQFGQGLVFTGIGAGLFYIASKIKVRWYKTGEVAGYK